MRIKEGGDFRGTQPALQAKPQNFRSCDRLAALLANLPTVFPAAESFLRYHLGHHAHIGSYELDISIPRAWEARFAGRSPIRKAAWLLVYPLLYPIRVHIMSFAVERRLRRASGWLLLLLNLLSQIAFDVWIFRAFGARALFYLGLSFLFAFGLHPLSAMTIQEYFQLRDGQDTYSYYGPLNLVTWNAGYHHEHHDLPSIPWVRLPALRRMAKEFHEPLHSYQSWTKLLLMFLFDRRISLWNRGVHGGQRRGLTNQPP